MVTVTMALRVLAKLAGYIPGQPSEPDIGRDGGRALRALPTSEPLPR
jgi:hypothetical protein